MLFGRYGPAAVALWAPLSGASPAVVDRPVQPQTGPMSRDNSQLAKRIATGFSLEQTLQNETLFDGRSDLFALLPVGAPPVTIVCASCCTHGTINASLTDDDIINPILRFDLLGVEAFVELDVVTNGGHTFNLPLLQSPPSPLGFSIPGGPSVGLTFQVDLIFDIEASIDLHGGFFFKLPDDAFFEASLKDGALTNIGFDGIISKSLPLTVNNNGTTGKFQVDLQLRAQVGIDTTSSIGGLIPGLFPSDIGAAAEVGVFVNLLEFVAQLQQTPTCPMQSDELFDLNVGAFFGADVKLGDSRSFGAVPTVSTTLFQAAIGTQCLVSAGAAFPTRAAALTPPVPSCAVVVRSTTTAIFGAATTTTPKATGAASTRTATITEAAGYGHGNGYSYPAHYRRSLHGKNNNNTTNTSSATTGAASDVLFTTTTLTITSCGAAVINCPASLQTVVEVPRTVCVSPATTAATGSCSAVRDAVTLSSLASSVVSTFTYTPPVESTSIRSSDSGSGSSNSNATWTRSGGGHGGSTTVTASPPPPSSSSATTYPGNGMLQVGNGTSSTNGTTTTASTSSNAIGTGTGLATPVVTVSESAERVVAWCAMMGTGLAVVVVLVL